MKKDLYDKAEVFFKELQKKITAEFQSLELTTKFKIDPWQRKESANIKNGGGITTVLENGQILEKAGINFSSVSGELPVSMSKVLTGKDEQLPFKACGVSLVIHPYSPLVPTTHANVRCLIVEDNLWFGGGSDLTPYYLDESDATHFHQVLKSVCDQYDLEYYPKYKEKCDKYFFLPHRNEARGIGGIFFD